MTCETGRRRTSELLRPLRFGTRRAASCEFRQTSQPPSSASRHRKHRHQGAIARPAVVHGRDAQGQVVRHRRNSRGAFQPLEPMSKGLVSQRVTDRRCHWRRYPGWCSILRAVAWKKECEPKPKSKLPRFCRLQRSTITSVMPLSWYGSYFWQPSATGILSFLCIRRSITATIIFVSSISLLMYLKHSRGSSCGG